MIEGRQNEDVPFAMEGRNCFTESGIRTIYRELCIGGARGVGVIEIYSPIKPDGRLDWNNWKDHHERERPTK